MFKKALSILLALMLVVASVSITAVSVSAADGDPDVYSVAGSSAEIFGGSWDAANTATEMTLDESDGLYKITFEDVQPDDAIQLKVLKNHGWDESWGDKETGDNYTFNVKTACDITVTFDLANEIVNVIGDGVTQDEDLDVYSVIAVGNGEDTYLNGANWDPADTSNAMTEDEDNPGVWKITMEDIYAFDNYNIKFAINSIDENGNPTSNPWAHNFGSEAEQLYPTGEDIEGFYNGKNCIFEVEEDESTVEITLDLRDFDFKTKKGAKFNIVVTAPGEETTAEPEETEAATTEAIAEETTAAEETQTPSTDGLKITATSNIFPEETQTFDSSYVGKSVKVVYGINSADIAESVQWSLTYDKDVLELTDVETPFAPDSVLNKDEAGTGKASGVCSDIEPTFALSNGGEEVEFVVATFKVKAAADTNVNLNVSVLETDKGIVVQNSEPEEAFDQFVSNAQTTTVIGDAEETPEETTTAEETEEETTAEETEAEETTAEVTEADETDPVIVGESLTVNSDSTLFSSDSKTYYAGTEQGIPETVTVTYYAKPTDTNKRLQAAQFTITFDPEIFSIDPAKNGYVEEDEDYDPAVMLPISGSAGQVNITNDHTVKVACSNEKGYKLADADGNPVPIATVVLDVKEGAKGTTQVLNKVAAMSFQNGTGKDNVDYIVYNVEGIHQDVYDELFADGGSIYSVIEPEAQEPVTEETTEAEEETTEEETEAPTTEEPTTEEPTTEEPTTEPVVDDAVYTVAGSSEAIFGTAWDATNTANDMTLDESDGLYKITYPNVEPEDAIQLKVVKNHGWDESFPEDNYTFNVKTPCDITVTFNPETGEVNVIGDGVTQDDDLDVYSVIAVGNGEDTYLNGANWDPCDVSNAMTEVSDGIWEITMEDIYAFDNYNIKFAINSIDEEGNPTSNPWANNFGSEEEKLYPTGEAIDAVWNGKNCIFEVEEDGSTVKLQLDLRDFDFKTKKGAKFTITVEGPEPIEPTTVEPTTEPAPSGDFLTVNAISNLFSSDSKTYYADGEGGIPESVTVTFYAQPTDANKRLQAAQFAITFDPEIFSIDPFKNGYVEEDEDYDPSVMLPISGDAGQVNITNDHTVKVACSSERGYKLADADGNPLPIATVVLDVKEGAKGITDVLNTVAAMSFQNGTGKDNVDYIVYNVEGLHQDVYDELFAGGGDIWGVIDPDGNEPATEPETAEEPTTEEPTTEEPTTEEPTTEEQTTEEPDNNLHVIATSNYFDGSEYDVKVTADGEYVTVNYFFNEDAKLDSVQWTMTYDSAMLQLVDGVPMPQISDAVYNVEDGMVRGIASTATSPVSIDSTQPFATFTFKALEPGETTVDLKVIDLELHEDEEPTTEPATEEPTTVEPTTIEPTEEPTTVEPTEEPTTVEPTTEEPTTEQPTTEEPATELKVKSTSNMFPTDTQTITLTGDDYVTVKYVLDKDTKLDSTQWKLTFENEYLELTGTDSFMPNIDNSRVVYNVEPAQIRAAASDSVNPFVFAADDEFVTVTFKVLKGGETIVNLDVVEFEEHEDEEPTTAEPTTVEPTTEEPTTVEPTTEEPTTVEPTTEEPTTVEPTTEEPTTVEPTTEEPTTVEPTTEEPTTVEPTTEEPTTVEPTTEEPTTEEPTTEEPTTVEPSTEATEATDDTSATEATDDTSVTEATDDTSVTDATSATGEETTTTAGGSGSSSTSDSAKGNSSSNGAVKTGSASMAIIILLALISATAGIYFARKRREK